MHVRLQCRRHQFVEREGRLWQDDTASRSQRDGQGCLDQFVRTIADKNSFRRPFGELRQYLDCRFRHELRIASPRTAEHAIDDLLLQIRRKLVWVLVLVKLHVGLEVLERVSSQSADFSLYDGGW